MHRWFSGALALAVALAPIGAALAEDEPPEPPPPAAAASAPIPPAQLMISGLLLAIGGTAALTWGLVESIRPAAQGVGRGVGTVLSCLFGCAEPNPMPRPIEPASGMAVPATVLGTVGMIAGFGLTIYGLSQVGADEAEPSAKVIAGPSSLTLDVRV